MSGQNKMGYDSKYWYRHDDDQRKLASQPVRVVFPVQSISGLRQIGRHFLTATCYITELFWGKKSEAFNNEKGNIIHL